MSYCYKIIVRNAIVRAAVPLLISFLIFDFAAGLRETDRRFNEMYQQQAEELEIGEPIPHADSSQTARICYIVSAAVFLFSLLPLSKILIPTSSKMAKSIKRYEKYEGEGNLKELMKEVDTDVAHAPAFGSVLIGQNWITGRAGLSGGAAVRLGSLRAVFCLKIKKTMRGASGIPKTSKEYALILLDDKFRDTVLSSSKESDIMDAYHTLLRRSEALIHGDYLDYMNFWAQDQGTRERAFREVERLNYSEKYL